ncbi:DUF3558 family protein [Actinokineospora fastidiosa]|uniref:DUF3558 domain-containing protein n=1 Tax=Actinokineospora fastidiosa TaxID=1816 RepID=A0A918GFT4_9PSEU|nr:DUF3558 family protein [Actinokineospora fastidiosa]GGS33358.1 hypothetical protein GCM10010171_29410 [Actinokineospora fastidiosa]
MLTALVPIVLTLAGCSTTEPGSAVSHETGTTTVPPAVTTPPLTEKPEPDAPPEIRDGPAPGDWARRPCDLLDDASARAVGIAGSAEVSTISTLGGKCLREQDGQRLEYVLYSEYSLFYQPYTRTTKWRYYGEAGLGRQLAGVFADEDPPTRECLVAVGLTAESSLEVTLSGPEDPDVCERALAVAAHVVDGIARG